MFGGKISTAELRSLEFSPIQNQNFFINTDIQFEVTIPKISPTEVQVIHDNNKKQENVTFKSMKKFENYEEGGTKIQIWYSFDSEGTYNLPPLKISVQGRESYIKFPAVKLEEDPAKMMPRIVIIFSNGVKIKSDDILKDEPIFKAYVGQKLTFTVYLQYINQLVHLGFDIPKNSIYKQLKTYEITEVKYREKSFSNNLIPVADFEWTGLAEGLQPIPKFKLTAIDYNGYRTELMLPEFEVNFVSNKKMNLKNPEESLFEDAFAEPFIETSGPPKLKIEEDQCKSLSDVFKKEKNAIFSSNKYKKQRIEMEESLGLPISKSPFNFNRGILILSIVIVVTFSILLILAIRKKYIFRVFILSILLFSSSIFMIFVIQKRSIQYGISKGCTVYSIPEQNAEASSEISPGNLVKITEKTGNWYYIQLGETSGWCDKTKIFEIN